MCGLVPISPFRQDAGHRRVHFVHVIMCIHSILVLECRCLVSILILSEPVNTMHRMPCIHQSKFSTNILWTGILVMVIVKITVNVTSNAIYYSQNRWLLSWWSFAISIIQCSEANTGIYTVNHPYFMVTQSIETTARGLMIMALYHSTPP